MELGITNLYKYIQAKKSVDPEFLFEEYQVADFFVTMIRAHAHLQSLKIAHRDIKPENIILVNEESMLFKVCDVERCTYCRLDLGQRFQMRPQQRGQLEALLVTNRQRCTRPTKSECLKPIIMPIRVMSSHWVWSCCTLPPLSNSRSMYKNLIN